MFQDIAPRWSHDGKQIAFLRRTTDRRYQLFLTSPDLSDPRPLLEPEIINPDRPYRPGLAGWRAPERLEWSPDDRQIVFSRVEWFTFDDGERLPGTGLWAYDLTSKSSHPLAIHPKDYEGSIYYFRSPQWSPDGKRVAFIGEGTYGETALFLRELGAESAITEKPRYDKYEDVDWPAWSPDGRYLAFRQGILRAMTADPVETLRIIEPGSHFTATPFRSSQWEWRSNHWDRKTPGSAVEPHKGLRITGIAWAQDGLRLAFTTVNGVPTMSEGSVWAADIPGATQPLGAPDPSLAQPFSGPVWHGDMIRVFDGEDCRIWDASSRTGGLRRGVNLPSDDFDWSPDSKQIVCSIPTNERPSAPTTLRVFTTGL